MNKARFIKLLSVFLSSAIGIGLIAFLPKRHNNKFEWSSGTNGRYLSEKGFIITEEDSPIWGEEFERYQKIQKANSKIESLDTIDDLKGKCRENLLKLNKEPINNGNSIHKMTPWEFVRLFCAGKTPLSIFLRGMENSPKRLSIKKEGSKSWSKIAKLLHGRNGSVETEKIKNFCTKVNWANEMRLIEELGFTLVACTNQLLKR